ncbi:RIP metalloprotease RseP [Patescibacteria group bacterium]|nr:RIP metalloprotease RseP [Patescibacteria group bacterium]
MATFIIFVLVLGVLVFTHEFGHFICAKKAGVKVEKFAIGFGPSVFSFRKDETLYTLNLVPFGGYVKIFGEEGREKVAGSFNSKPACIRALIVAAGVFFNFLLAFFLLFLVNMIGAPVPVGDGALNSRITILEVQPNSPAQKAGLEAGDKILSLSFGEEVLDAVVIADVQNFISSHSGQEIVLKYLRGQETFSARVTPDPIIGIAMDNIAIVSMSFFKAIWESFKETIFLTGFMVKMFGFLIADIFRGGEMVNQVSGPVGVFGIVGKMAAFGFVYILRFTALFSINLAVLNLIPFPALDGGHLILLAIEAIKRSPVNQKFVNIVNTAGFAALIILMILVTYKDIVRLL